MADSDKPSRPRRDAPVTDASEARPSAAPSRAEVVAELQRLARSVSPRELDEPRVQQRHHRIHAAAIEVFGRWDVALASALREALGGASRVRRPPTPMATSPVRPVPANGVTAGAPREPRAAAAVLRQPHPGAMRPVVVLTERGFILSVDGPALTASDVAAAPVALRGWVEALGAPVCLLDVGATESIVAVASDGRVFEYRSDEIPHLTLGAAARRLGERHGVARWLTLLPSEAVSRPGLWVHATAGGRVKVSTTGALQRALDAHRDDDAPASCQAFAADPHDEAIGAWIAERSDALLLASSSGHIIHLELDALRPAALTGAAVRAIQLKAGARVVGGTIGARGLELALVTRRGCARRLPIDMLRTQARGGVGQACERLEGDDRLAAIMTCHPSTDLALLTDHARALRVPAPLLPLTERVARGSAVIELDDGESVVGLSRLLPLAYTSTSPNVFEI